MRIQLKLAAIILSGGQSSRMGTDKSQLLLSGKSLSKHAHDCLVDSGISNIFLSNENGIKDIYQGKGPVAGIYSCMKQLPQYSHILFIPVDMPFLTKDLILNLIDASESDNSYYHNQPLPCLLHNSETNKLILEKLLKGNNYSVFRMHDLIHSKILNDNNNPECFININTRNDLHRATAIMKQKSQ